MQEMYVERFRSSYCGFRRLPYGPCNTGYLDVTFRRTQTYALQLTKILQGYCEFHDFNPRERHLIEALRTLRMLHFTGWLAKRWADPAFPVNFPWFNTPVFWQNQLRDLQEQIELLDQIEC